MSRQENRGDARRTSRVEREMREVIGTYLIGGFRGELPGIVSITRVIVSKDLRNAKVLVTTMGDAVEGREQPTSKVIQKATVQELQAHAHEVQHEVNRRLRMKHCPRLTFIYDEGFDHALKVDNILRDLQREREAGAGADSREGSFEEEE
jgi:ribosome-binding factor A